MEDFTFVPNTCGLIAHNYWRRIPDHFSGVKLDAFVIMPNHVHGIILITEQTGITLGQIVGWYKFQAMQEINRFRNQPGKPVWQRGYYEHIIRKSEDIGEIRKYILGNPAKWNEDEYNKM